MSTQKQSETKPKDAAEVLPKQSPPPWQPIFAAHDTFLNDLECIAEMFSLIAPVIKSKDEERNKRILELSEEIETEKGKVRRLKSAQDVTEFIGHLRKLQRAEYMFRQNTITSIVSNLQKLTLSQANLLHCQQSCRKSKFMNSLLESRRLPIVLLTGSNLFMTFALAFNGIQCSMDKTAN